jgi:hypothetical protein
VKKTVLPNSLLSGGISAITANADGLMLLSSLPMLLSTLALCKAWNINVKLRPRQQKGRLLIALPMVILRDLLSVCADDTRCYVKHFLCRNADKAVFKDVVTYLHKHYNRVGLDNAGAKSASSYGSWILCMSLGESKFDFQPF